MSTDGALVAGILLRGEPEPAEAFELRTLLVRHVLADGDPQVSSGLLDAYCAARKASAEAMDRPEPKTLPWAEAEKLSMAACVRGFRRILPDYGEDRRVLEAAYSWPDALPMNPPCGLSAGVVEEIFYAMGYKSGRETRAWYAYCAKREAV